MQQPMQLVRDRYESLRELSRNASYSSLPLIIRNKYGAGVSKSEVVLNGLSFSAFEELARWKNLPGRKANWDWNEVRKLYRSHPKRFELSIWHRNSLCGASIGRPTQSAGKLRVDFIEAAPEKSVLEGTITDIVLLAGTVYAKAIGATQVRIMKPANEDVKNYYLSKPGFSFDKVGNFCFKDI